MDSSGIGVIVGRYKKIQARGGTTMVIRVQPQVDKVLEISGIKKILMCSREGENRGELYEVASAGENIRLVVQPENGGAHQCGLQYRY